MLVHFRSTDPKNCLVDEAVDSSNPSFITSPDLFPLNENASQMHIKSNSIYIVEIK